MPILDRISIYYLVIIFLLSLYFLGTFTFGLQKVLMQALPAVFTTTAAGLFFDYLELKRWSKPLTPLITGLIIGLVAQFGASSIILAIIGLVAMVIKFLVKWDGRHIFNPAGAGLFVGMFLGSYPSWWVGGENFWIYLIWIPILLYKLKRWTPMVGFLAPVVLFSGPSILTSSSSLFFTSVMLIEPKTSPATVKLGLVYGAVVAAGYLILGRFSQFDPLILSLLISNLTQRIISRYSNI
ncbi:MAG: hypothetical protein AAB414_03540 [Patescibacteria group bacterium]